MILLGWFLGLFMVANGVLLVFSSKRFLRFYDIWARGDYVSRAGNWRNNLGGFEGKLLGLVFLIAGVAVLYSVSQINVVE
jgi:hypothetical protein